MGKMVCGRLIGRRPDGLFPPGSSGRCLLIRLFAVIRSSWLYAANYFFTFTQIVSPCDWNRTGEIFSSSRKVVRIFVWRVLIV